MATYTITISTDDDILSGPLGGGRQELARLLMEQAQRVQDGMPHDCPIIDLNGNTVGHAEITHTDAEDTQ